MVAGTWCFVVRGKCTDISEVPAVILLSHSSRHKSLCYAFIVVSIVFINAGVFVVEWSLICIMKEVEHSRIMPTNLWMLWRLYLQYLPIKIIVYEIKNFVVFGAYVFEVCNGFENNIAEGKSWMEVKCQTSLFERTLVVQKNPQLVLVLSRKAVFRAVPVQNRGNIC